MGRTHTDRGGLVAVEFLPTLPGVFEFLPTQPGEKNTQ